MIRVGAEGIPACTGSATVGGMPPPGGVDANELGLTNAVPARASYVTDGHSRTPRVDGPTSTSSFPGVGWAWPENATRPGGVGGHT